MTQSELDRLAAAIAPSLAQYQTPQPQPHVVYVPQTPTPPQTSVDRITVPLLLVVSAGVFIGWASWFGTTSINSIQSDIKEISNKLVTYVARSDERVSRIERSLDARAAERWTKNEQALFCAKTEAIPGNTGWKCAETENGRASLDSPSIWNGHLNGAAPVADIEFPPADKWPSPKIKTP